MKYFLLCFFVGLFFFMFSVSAYELGRRASSIEQELIEQELIEQEELIERVITEHVIEECLRTRR